MRVHFNPCPRKKYRPHALRVSNQGKLSQLGLNRILPGKNVRQVSDAKLSNESLFFIKGLALGKILFNLDRSYALTGRDDIYDPPVLPAIEDSPRHAILFMPQHSGAAPFADIENFIVARVFQGVDVEPFGGHRCKSSSVSKGFTISVILGPSNKHHKDCDNDASIYAILAGRYEDQRR